MSIRYSQDFKDSLVKLHQEGRSLKSLSIPYNAKKINYIIQIPLKLGFDSIINYVTIKIKDNKLLIKINADYSNFKIKNI